MTALPTFTTLGAGPTILMLHDVGGGHRAFAPQVESFAAAGYRAVAWDMPGYGHSAPIDPYTFKGLAQSCSTLIETLMQTKGGGGVVLLGHGMGGMLAQEVVARRPELVTGEVSTRPFDSISFTMFETVAVDRPVMRASSAWVEGPPVSKDSTMRYWFSFLRAPCDPGFRGRLFAERVRAGMLEGCIMFTLQSRS